ncbi:hypothetical protein MCOR25_005557 [Pyricularia grisea]|nr:hypothetical protein MCOR25_005557 [Pyricularia grisea]
MEFPDQILELVSSFLSFGDTHIICQQFDRVWRPNKQVLWNGVKGFREVVQKWADKNELQTLTTVMGSLLSKSNPSYGRNGGDKRSNYMKGASALFAWYISKGDKVTVLALPPDENGDRFNPSPYTNYRGIEEPIVKGQLGNKAVGEMVILHPTLPEAEKFFYPLWPLNGLLAMKAILDTRGRGVWDWRTPSISKTAKACLDSIISKDAGECTVTGVAADMPGKKMIEVQAHPKVETLITSTASPDHMQHAIAKRPAGPSDCSRVEKQTMAVTEVSMWLCSEAEVEPVCEAMRLVLAADKVRLGRALQKLAVLRKTIVTLHNIKVQEEKAAKKSLGESPRATSGNACLREQRDQGKSSEPRQPSADVPAKRHASPTAAPKAAKTENISENNKRKKEEENKRKKEEENKRKKEEENKRKKEEENKRKAEIEKQKQQGKGAENSRVNLSAKTKQEKGKGEKAGNNKTKGKEQGKTKKGGGKS